MGVLGAKRRHDFRRLVGVHGVPLRRICSADELVKFSLGTIDDIGHGLAGGPGPGDGLHVLLELRRPFFEIRDSMRGLIAAFALGRDDDGADAVELVVVDALDGGGCIRPVR